MTLPFAVPPAPISGGRAASRARVALLGALLFVAACTSDSTDEAGAGTSTIDPGSTTTTVATTTTVPPIFLGVSPNLDLVANECFADLPTPTSVATSEPDEELEPNPDEPSTLDTEPTVPDTLPVTTTIPTPPMLALVDCNGTNLGQVFATFCVGDDEEASGQLTAVACPGDPDLEYPGDRSLRRAAARICLQRFEETFKQPYSIATRIAQEFVPTEGVWNRDDRRVVCHSTEPPPPTTTTEPPAE
jgi:hypothetical protein